MQVISKRADPSCCHAGGIFPAGQFYFECYYGFEKKGLALSSATAFSILMYFLLVGRFQIIGLCMSTLAGRLFYTIGFPILLNKRMAISSKFFGSSDFQKIIIGCILFVAGCVF
jgi:hypothetical protein